MSASAINDRGWIVGTARNVNDPLGFFEAFLLQISDEPDQFLHRPPPPIPEPSTSVLLALGLGMTGCFMRRRRVSLSV